MRRFLIFVFFVIKMFSFRCYAPRYRGALLLPVFDGFPFDDDVVGATFFSARGFLGFKFADADMAAGAVGLAEVDVVGEAQRFEHPAVEDVAVAAVVGVGREVVGGE